MTSPSGKFCSPQITITLPTQQPHLARFLEWGSGLGIVAIAAAISASTRTVLQSDDAYDRLERDLDEFDVVFAYPWPEEEGLYRKLFARHAADGAVLVVYGQLDGVRALRKVAGRGS